MKYILLATFKNSQTIQQEVEAKDTAEAFILFATRPFIQLAVTDDDGEKLNDLERIEVMGLAK